MKLLSRQDINRAYKPGEFPEFDEFRLEARKSVHEKNREVTYFILHGVDKETSELKMLCSVYSKNKLRRLTGAN